MLDPSACPTEPKIPTIASLNRDSKGHSNSSPLSGSPFSGGSDYRGSSYDNRGSSYDNRGGSAYDNRGSSHDGRGHRPMGGGGRQGNSTSTPKNAGGSYAGKDVFYFSVKNPHACSPRYIELYYKKSQLIMRMLEIRIGQELMMQVIFHSSFVLAISFPV